MNSDLSSTCRYRKNLLNDLVQQLEQKQRFPHIRKIKQVSVNPEDVKKSMRTSWKDSGYGNSPFGGILPLKGGLLSQWQIQRIPLSKRSYSTPKSSKTLKFHTQSKQFGPKYTKKQYSAKFLSKLQKVKQQYENKKFTHKADELNKYNEKLKKVKAEGMKISTSSNFFGLKSKIQSNSNEFKSFKSQVFLKRTDYL